MHKDLQGRFRPLYGVSLFLQTKVVIYFDKAATVFVPSTGYLYFYVKEEPVKEQKHEVFVPSSGYLYFYLNVKLRRKKILLNLGFRPLYGVSLFLLSICLYSVFNLRFRPLYGVSLFLPSLVFSLKIQRELSGLRCKRTNQIISCS